MAVEPGDEDAKSQVPLGHRAMRGAFWSVLFSILNKVTTFGGQIVLAWLLVPADFGLVALATSISSMLGVISVASLGDIIVQQKDEAKFRLDFGQVFWLCNSVNVVLAGGVLIAAPWIARAYHQPQLVPLLVLIEVNGLLTGLSLVYGSALKRALKFKSLAGIFFVAGTAQSLVSMLMAWRGFGAYSILVPLALSSLIGLVFQVRAAGPLPLGRPQPRLWPAYLASSFWLLFLAILLAMPAQGTSFIMGFAQTPGDIGIYFWGFSLANQVVFLICNNLRQVLFPTFARLNGQPERQGEALKKAAHVMMTVLAYLCVLQAVTARPLIALIFPNRWESAGPVVSWISLGLVTQPLTVLFFSIAMAQAHYRHVAANAAVQGLLVMVCAAVGSLPQGSGPQSAAAWTALGFFLGGLYCGWEMLRPYADGGWSALARLLAKPLLMAAGSGLAGMLLLQATAGHGWYVSLLAGATGVTTAYAGAIRLFDMDSYRELRNRL